MTEEPKAQKGYTRIVNVTKWTYIPERAFYIWAILLGPVWTQHLSTFLLWFSALVFLGIATAYFAYKPEVIMHYMITEDEPPKRRHWFWARLGDIPWFANVVVMIYAGWIATAIIQLLAIGAHKLMRYDIIETLSEVNELAESMFSPEEMDQLRAELKEKGAVKAGAEARETRKDLH